MVDLTHQRCLAAVLVVIGSLMPLVQARALEYGTIRVDSYLNQPLDARIPLTALAPDELSALDVRIAPATLFKRFGIERSADVGRLRIDVSKADARGRAIIHVRTRAPFREPFVDFLLAANTGNGQMLREYTVLLDPPPAAAGDTQSGRTLATRSAPEPAVTARHQAPSPLRPHSGRYGPVQAGDTLWHIAKQVRPAGVTVAQMAVAIYRANPDAFAGGIDMLHRGAFLTIPGATAATAISAAAARQRLTASTAPIVSPGGQEKPPVAAAAVEDNKTAPVVTTEVDTPTSGQGATDQTASTHTANTPPPAVAAAATSVPAAATAASPGPVPPDKPAPSAADPPAGETAGDMSLQTDPGQSVPNRAAGSEAAAPENSKQAEETVEDPGLPVLADANAEPVTGKVYDVSGAGEAGPLAWQDLWYLALLAALVALAAVWLRRRQYKPVPLGNDGEVEASPSLAEDAGQPLQAPSVPGAVEDSREARNTEPVTAIAAAEAHLQRGEFSTARDNLEAALAETPREPALQDKLFEVDYLTGDAARFSTDVERFSADLQVSSARRAGIAAMGRILLPGDARFETGEQTIAATPPRPDSGVVSKSTADDLPVGDATNHAPANPPPEPEEESSAARLLDQSSGPRAADDTAGQSALELPPDEAGARGAVTADDDSRDHDAGAAEPGDYQWEPIDIDTGTQREHDLGADSGLAFDLDSADAGEAWQPASKSKEDAPVAAVDAGSERPELIDAEAFDLDTDEPSQDQRGVLAADTVEIRLDLARMYLDMEDAQMARSLLEEVIANGNSAQQETARSLLEQTA